MKSLLLLLLFPFGLMAQVQTAPDGTETFTMTEGDTTYLMKKYFFVMLKTGPNRNQSAEEAAEIQKGHLAHINRMAEAGVLDLAGPFGDDTEWRGILVLRLPDEASVMKWVEQDPAYRSGRLIYEIHPWWAAVGSRLN